MPLFRSLLTLVLPGALLLSAGLYLQLWAEPAPSLTVLLKIFPPAVAAVALLLGWRFNRTRIIWAVLLLILVERLLAGLPSGSYPVLFDVASILLPLNLMLIAWWRERGLVTGHGLLRAGLILLQLCAVAWLWHRYGQDVLGWADAGLVDWPPVQGLPLVQPALAAVGVSLAGALWRCQRQPEALSAAFCWAILCVSAGFWWPAQFDFWAGIAGLILIIGLLESGFSMAFDDELTGLPARRAMNELLLKLGRRYVVAMVDVDHFKKVNDTYGHDVGDQVLRMVATCLRSVRGGGRAFRYGGEEFAVIFPGKELEQVLPHLEALREQIGAAEFGLRGYDRPAKKPDRPPRGKKAQRTLQVTVSIGAAAATTRGVPTDRVLKAADQALYKAKKGGRNRVCT